MAAETGNISLVNRLAEIFKENPKEWKEIVKIKNQDKEIALDIAVKMGYDALGTALLKPLEKSKQALSSIIHIQNTCHKNAFLVSKNQDVESKIGSILVKNASKEDMLIQDRDRIISSLTASMCSLPTQDASVANAPSTSSIDRLPCTPVQSSTEDFHSSHTNEYSDNALPKGRERLI